MKKIIVYGMGLRFKEQKHFLESVFDIVAYCDRTFFPYDKYITPDRINDIEFDAIYISSAKYYEEIRSELIDKYDIPADKIVTIYELLGVKEGSEERKQWVIDQLQKIPAGKTILDAGAGELKFKPYCKHLNYIAQDFGKYDPSMEPGGISGGDTWDTSGCDIISDIIDIPLEDMSVDAILCTEVFEHLKNPILAVKEFSRLLKPGGLLLLTAPFCSLTHMAPHFYYNGFSEYWYRVVLSEYQFDVKQIDRNGNLFQYFSWWLYRMDSLAHKYTGEELKAEDIMNIYAIVNKLSILSDKDTGSSESLCFGHNVIAYKRSR